MERKRTARIPMNIAPAACFYLSLLCLLLPLQWVAAFLISTVIHEVCHLAALKLCRAPILSVNIHALGMEIRTLPLLPIQEMFCALAGPLGSAGLLLLGKWMPLTALCGLFHLLYNLLPIYPADGGRILRSFLEMLLPDVPARNCSRILEKVALCAVAIIGLYAFLVLRLGLLPLLAVAVVFCRCRNK